MRVSGRRAVWNHRDGLTGRMCRIGFDFDIQHGRQTAKALRTDPQRIDPITQFDPQGLGLVLRTAGLELAHVDGLHERFLGHEHRFFCRATDADAKHAWWTPPCTHQGHCFEHPLGDVIRGVQHREFRLILGAAAFGRDVDIDGIAGDYGHVNDRRRVVARVFAFEQRIVEDRRSQLVVAVEVGTPDPFVDHVFN